MKCGCKKDIIQGGKTKKNTQVFFAMKNILKNNFK